MSRSLRTVAWALPAVALTAVAAVAAVAGARRSEQRIEPARRDVAGVVLAAASSAHPEEPPPEPTRCPPEPPIAVRGTEFPPPLELVRLIREDPKSLGSASIGSPTSGRMWGAIELSASDAIEPRGDHPWGTEAVVRSIERAVREVARCLPGAPKLAVGDISRKEGGWLRPHRSHQSGLDADLGYYYSNGAVWFTHASAKNLDRARTWALVRALVDGGNVESIFMDHSVQKLLREHVETLDDDRSRIAELFEKGKRDHKVIIHHARGHATHFHVRFTDPASLALGVRLGSMLSRRPVISKATSSRGPRSH